jgi:hypothetical protein
MDIFFDFVGGISVPPPFVLKFEPEHMSLQSIGDLATITVQAYIERRSSYWNDPRFQKANTIPVLLALHGILYTQSLFQGNQGIGASLVSNESFPLAFPDENSQLVNLSFHCSRSYIQRVEEQRGTESNLALSSAFWAIMCLPPQSEKELMPQLVHIQSRQSGYINISRSHWSDMLSSIGYPQRRYIELPTLNPQEGFQELNKAIEHVNQAHALFAQDRYREAVQRCRQARDALLGEPKPTWSQRILVPIIGNEKAGMVNESIKALNSMGNEASHGAGIEVDRDEANYVISSMILILDYIGRKLR